jgi:ATP synthase F1 delta subunit
MKLRSTKNLAEAIYQNAKGKNGAELSATLANAVEFMDKHQLLGKSKEILSQLEKIIDKDEKVLRAKVTSSTVLSKKMVEDLEESLKKRYKAKSVEIDTKEDSNLINGLKIEANDEIIDLTLSHRLHQLQAHLIKN